MVRARRDPLGAQSSSRCPLSPPAAGSAAARAPEGVKALLVFPFCYSFFLLFR